MEVYKECAVKCRSSSIKFNTRCKSVIIDKDGIPWSPIVHGFLILYGGIPGGMTGMVVVVWWFCTVGCDFSLGVTTIICMLCGWWWWYYNVNQLPVEKLNKQKRWRHTLSLTHTLCWLLFVECLWKNVWSPQYLDAKINYVTLAWFEQRRRWVFVELKNLVPCACPYCEPVRWKNRTGDQE